MAIPSIICRGKNLHLAAMKQFFAALPLRAMPKDEFLDYAEKRMTGFKQTHSQIARQMGLYYCDENNVCHPRFYRAISLDQILSYCRYWAEHYFVPNPYTPSFPDSCQPTCVYGYVVANCEKYDGELDKILFSIFNQRLNEGDKVKAYLLQFTGIIEDKNGRLVCDKLPNVGTSVTLNRSNELAYFHYYDAWGQDCSVESIEESRKKEFYSWLISKKLTPDYAEDLVNFYLVCLSDELKMPPVKTAWHGLREYLYGEKPVKSIYAVADSHELMQYYGEIDRLFAKVADPGPLDATRFNECRAWADSKDNNRAVRAAWIQYKDFIKWRDEQATIEEFPKNVDLLSIALKLFDKEREESDKHSKYADLARTWFADYTPQKLKDDFATFQRDLIWSGMVRAQVTKDYAYVDKLADLLDELKKDPRPLAYYLGDEFKAKMDECPGIGISTIVDMLMKMHPDEYCAYTDMMHSSLKMLRLLPADASTKLNSENYRRAMGLYEEIRQRMMQMGIMRTGGECKDAPDFLTVNSFLWFVKENIDLIKEKVMEKKMKTGAPTKFTGSRKQLEFRPDSKEDELLLRLLAALRAKSFAILAGHSGTGKSRYVKKLAYMTCNADELRTEGQLPGNYLLLQVKPNWHDSTDLLGFRNAMDDSKYQKTALIEFLFRAYHFKDTPFFLCLDEMNLAPVEQYFAEFLSAMESKEPVPLNDITADRDEGNLFELGCEWADALDFLKANKFSIPKNLFIVGTVNMDETTNQFSRKVLDRAFTIEMTDVDFKSFNAVEEPSYKDTIEEEKIVALLNGEKSVAALDPDDIADGSALVKVQKALEPTAFAIAYRFANEYTLLKRAIKCFDASDTVKLDALDQAVLMKILPRVAGEKDYIKKVYGESEDKGLRGALKGKEKSLKKIADIMKRADDMNASYVTFWP